MNLIIILVKPVILLIKKIYLGAILSNFRRILFFLITSVYSVWSSHAWSNETGLMIGFAGSGSITPKEAYGLGYCSTCLWDVDWENLVFQQTQGTYRQYVEKLTGGQDYQAGPLFEGYKIPPSNPLNSSNTDNIIIKGMLTSAYPPALAYFNRQLFAAYVDKATKQVRMAYRPQGKNYWVMINSNSGRVLNLRSGGSPALISYGNELYLSVRGLSSKKLYIAKSSTGKNWTQSNLKIPGVKSASGPSFSTLDTNSRSHPFSRSLVLSFRGSSSDYIYTMELDRSGNWQNPKRVKSFKTSNTPDIMSFNGGLLLAFKGVSSNNIYTSWSHNGVDWSDSRKLPKSIRSNRGPALGCESSGCYIVFKGISSNRILYSSTSDGINWSSPQIKQGLRTSGSIRLSNNDYLYPH